MMTEKEVIYRNPDGTTVVKKFKLVDKFNEDGYLYKDKKRTIKNEFKLLPRELTRAERGDLGDIRTLIGKDQLLVYRSGNKWKPYTTKKIAEFLGSTERQVKRLIKKAKECGVIASISILGEEYYIYNPYYERANKRISFIVYLAFQDTVFRDTIEPVYRAKFQEQILEKGEGIELLKWK